MWRWRLRAGRLAWRFRDLWRDLGYTVKSLCSVLSGYVGLEFHGTEGEWLPVEACMPYMDQPYYVCARFRNRKHLPLPLVLGDKSEYPVQNVVLAALRRLGFLRRAAADCRAYEERWQQAA